MASPISQGRQVAWEVLAQCWADTYFDTAELQGFAEELAATQLSLRELDRIAYRDVCGAFALFTLGAFLTFGMFTPDFGYPRLEARDKIARWVARPLLPSLVNPAWWIGYLAAVAWLSGFWRPLRARIRRLVARPAA